VICGIPPPTGRVDRNCSTIAPRHISGKDSTEQQFLKQTPPSYPRELVGLNRQLRIEGMTLLRPAGNMMRSSEKRWKMRCIR
jgi:hypothetical protein